MAMTVPQHGDNYFTLCHNVTNELSFELLFIIESFKSLIYANAINRIVFQNSIELKFDTQKRKVLFKSCLMSFHNLVIFIIN